jgi:hypothetical protein
MIRTAAIVLFFLPLWAAPLVAQSSVQPARYDGTAEKAIAGTVKAVVTFQDAAGTVGVHLDLQTAEGLVSVHLAPAMFMGEHNFSFFADDQVAIIGTPTLHDGNTAASSLGGMFGFGRAGSQVENLGREDGPGMDHQVGR